MNTAHALTQYLLTRPRPSLVIQTGIAGAYVPGGLSVEAVALATSETYGDVGVLTPQGWRPADEIGIPLVDADGAFLYQNPSLPLSRPLYRQQLSMQLAIEVITRATEVKERIEDYAPAILPW